MRKQKYTDAQVRAALRQSKGDCSLAAERLGCSMTAVYRRAKKLGIKAKCGDGVKRAPMDAERRRWERFKHGDQSAANEIAEAQIPMVRRIISHMARSLPPCVDREELLSSALGGLYDAMRKYDPDRGWKFSTYALARIRGAILDGIRRNDRVSRLDRSRIHRCDQAQAQLGHAAGHNPTEDEVLETARLSSPEAARIGAQLRETSLETTIAQGDRYALTIAEVIPTKPTREDRADLDRIDRITRGLEFETRMALWAYFGIGHKYWEIGYFLGLSESRISQMISDAIEQLRARPALAEEFGKERATEETQHG